MPTTFRQVAAIMEREIPRTRKGTNMHISQLRESNYLQKNEVEPPILVTIKGDLTQENLAMEGKPPEMKWVIRFHELEKSLVLNSTNGQLIAQATGSENSEDWDGKQVVLYNDTNVSFQGKLTGGIRVRAAKKNAKGQALPPESPRGLVATRERKAGRIL